MILQFAAGSKQPNVECQRRGPLFLTAKRDGREAEHAGRSDATLGDCLKPSKARDSLRITQQEPHAYHQDQDSGPSQLEQVRYRTRGAQGSPVFVSIDLRIMMHFATHSSKSARART